MEEAMGLINLANEEDELQALTRARCSASVPFGGRYRFIDFALSSLVNSGVRSVAVLAQQKYRSLMDHLGNGAAWDLDRKRGGLFILPPPVQKDSSLPKGDIAFFAEHIDYFLRGIESHVIMCGSRVIGNIDARQALLYHRNIGADVTVLYKEWENEAKRAARYRALETEEDGQISHMDSNPGFIGGTKASLEMYIVRKEWLLEIIESCIQSGKQDFVRDGIIANLGQARVYGYRYPGYAAMVRTIEDYYVESMNLLAPDVWKALFMREDPVYTKVKDEPPTLYKEGASVKNSLIANGCVIEGTVENSILFRGVKVGHGAHIKNSILLQHCEIGEGAYVECVIADKEACIGSGRTLAGREDFPVLVAKRTTI
jgi:glucose-1-phosphate adenylyltransferase